MENVTVLININGDIKMKVVKIKNKTYNLPESYNEISFEEYCKVFYNLKETDKIEDDEELTQTIIYNESIILSRLLKEDDNFCLDIPYNEFKTLTGIIQFIYKNEVETKNEITVDGVKYHIPKPEKFSLRQYIDIDTTLQEDNELKYIELLSILLVKDDEKYDGNYKELFEKLKKIKASEALPLIFFFFQKGKGL